MRMTRSATLAILALALLSGAIATSRVAAKPKPKASAYHPVIDPANFQPAVDNPYFPLVPGTTFTFVEKLGKHTTENVITVTHDTRTIMGVTCVVVRDIVRETGRMTEDTFDWYAQDKQGNVWYFGEDSRNFQHGRFVKGDDSWEAGVDGAKPGIIMEATPRRGDTYRQEYFRGHAEDQARVLGGGGKVKVPYRTYAKTLTTVERSRLEPGARERKFYAAGVGEIKSKVVRGDHEAFSLVSITRRPG